ncbi:FkbM family methyltransferase [Paraburkholderia nemoris]|uniref:FkbM family methyltransferase n=1 Tax=Paraburkholderia nemoris TaxID=2793076 RepID=UPI0038B96A95
MTIVSYAQNFEDVMLWRALHDVKCGFYIDIGAQHPLIDSVSKVFYEHGWRGINVEPSIAYAELLRNDRPEDQVIQAAVSSQASIQSFHEIPDTGLSSLNAEIVAHHKERGFSVRETTTPCVLLDDVFGLCVGHDVHWLKIDVEGHETNVLLGWRNSRTRPWIVVLESTQPLTRQETHADWEPLLLDKGYRFAWFDGLNRFYVHESQERLVERFYAPPNVFDDFVLSGTSSAPFALRLKNEVEHQISVRTDERAAIAREHEVAQEKIRAEITGKERQLQDLISSHAVELNVISEEGRQAADRHASEMNELLNAFTRLETEHAELKKQQQTEQTEILRLVVQEQASRASTEALRSQREADLVSQLRQVSEHIAKREALFADLQAQERNSASLVAERHHEAQLQLSRELERARRELGSLRNEQTLRTRQFADEVNGIRRDLETQLRERASREHQLTSQLAKVNAERLVLAQIQEEQLSNQQRRLLDLESSVATREQDVKEARAEVNALLLERARREREISSRFAEISEERVAIIQAYESQLSDLKSSFEKREEEHVLRLDTQERRVHDLELNCSKFERDVDAQIAAAKQLVAELSQARVALAHSARSGEPPYQDALVDSAIGYQALTDQVLADACSNPDQYLALSTQLARDNRVLADYSLRVVKEELDEMRRTFSWRVTKPLRIFGKKRRQQKTFSLSMPRDPLPREDASINVPEPHVHVGSVPDDRFGVTVTSDFRMPAEHFESSPILRDGVYHVEDLLRLNDIEFIEHAYRAILNRAPDANGLQYYLGRLRLGYSKSGILGQIKRSTEARSSNTEVRGMERIKLIKWSRLPFVGRFIALFDADADNENRRRVRRIENSLYLLDQRATRRFNDIDNQLITVTDRLHQIVANLQVVRADVNAAASQVVPDGTSTGPSIEEVEAHRLTPEARRLFEQLIHTPESASCAS